MTKAMALPSHEHGAAICISESRGFLFAVHHPLPRGLENTAYMAICNARIAIAHVSESGDILMMVGRQLKLHRPNAKRGKNFNITYAIGYMAVNNTNLKLMVHVDGWYTRLTGRTALKTVVVDRLVASPLHQSSFTNRSRLVKQAKGVHITS
nr:F-box/kelch-repeat protein At3g23880-like [Ipomoea batatas]